MRVFSPANRSEIRTSLRQCVFPAIPSQRESIQEASLRYDSALGMGTMRSRLRNPTAFSTLPFSHPLAGLRNPTSTR